MSLKILLKDIYLSLHPKYITVIIPIDQIAFQRADKLNEIPRTVSNYYEYRCPVTKILYYYYCDFKDFSPLHTYLFLENTLGIVIDENKNPVRTNKSSGAFCTVIIQKEDYFLF